MQCLRNPSSAVPGQDFATTPAFVNCCSVVVILSTLLIGCFYPPPFPVSPVSSCSILKKLLVFGPPCYFHIDFTLSTSFLTNFGSGVHFSCEAPTVLSFSLPILANLLATVLVVVKGTKVRTSFRPLKFLKTCVSAVEGFGLCVEEQSIESIHCTNQRALPCC